MLEYFNNYSNQQCQSSESMSLSSESEFPMNGLVLHYNLNQLNVGCFQVTYSVVKRAVGDLGSSRRGDDAILACHLSLLTNKIYCNWGRSWLLFKSPAQITNPRLDWLDLFFRFRFQTNCHSGATYKVGKGKLKGWSGSNCLRKKIMKACILLW